MDPGVYRLLDILLHRWSLRHFVERVLIRRAEPRRCHRAIVTNLVARGHFLGAHSSTYLHLHPESRSLKVLPVELPRSSATGHSVITLKDRTLSPLARLFIERACEVAKPRGKKKS